MNFNIFRRLSLKTKVTILTLAIFLFSILSLAFYASRMLHGNMQRLSGEQQFSTVSFIAAEINHELDERLRLLERIAANVNPAWLSHTASLQSFLEERPDLQGQFNGGVIAYRRDGSAIAEVPLSVGRVGVNYMDRDYMVGALKNGKATIGRPVMGPKLKAPVFVMAVPIRDAQGTVIGALGGVTDLSQPNFLDVVTQSRYGKTGGYLLVAPQHRLIVTATDRRRIMEALPAPGVLPLIDRFLQGDEGSDVFVNPLGVEVLASVKRIPVAGWYVAAMLPTAEAFAPIRDTHRYLLLATAFLTLLAAGLTWWMVRRQLAPMLAAVNTLAALSDSNQPPQPLPITRKDEIGKLIGGFNRLLETLGRRDAALRESEQHFRILIEWSPDAIAVHRGGIVLYVNPAAVKMFGAESENDLEGKPLIDRFHPDFHEIALARMKSASEHGVTVPMLEEKLLKLDGTVIDVEVQATPIVYDGIPAIHAVMREVTELKRAGEALRIAATAFESQEGMLITNAANVILRVNKAFTQITGYTAEEVTGQTPKLFSSGRQNAAFYQAMYASIAHTGGWHGEIWNRRKSGEVFPEWLTITAVKDNDGVLTHYVATLTDITQRKAAADQIQNLAFYDPLTQLPNRRLLLDRLHQALASSARSGREGALLYIDLDDFKTLNDTLGHDKGDLLLQQVAQRLGTCVREGDTVARLGGDEFIVMLEELSGSAADAAAQAEVVGEKILVALNQSYQLADHSYHGTPSIGVALFVDHQDSVDELLKRADLAMYQAKAAGRNTLRFFDPAMQSVVTKRVALEAGLREALEKEQFVLYYQAQVAGKCQSTGVEVLVRWNHPQRGLVSPAEFIPLAEETGLILPLGQWVLETACSQLTLWATQPEMEHLTVAVNVSARQFRQPDFVAQVLAVLDRTGANPQRLKLELTESLLVSNVEDIIAKMSALKAHGVGFSLDDFGTGYSSLSYLKRLPLDQLKIDQGFVRDILIDSNDAAIAQMVIVLAASLGLAVIAEGVETQAQHDFLADQGCHVYQGYLFSRPLPLEEFEAFVRRV